MFVENLEISIDFYKNILGLEQCHFEAERRTAFFWIGKPKEAMLGLWEKPKGRIDKRHFAFKCDKEIILDQSVQFLNRHGLKPYNFLKDGIDRPIVFAWMPAISFYFNDPDGHYLEFTAILEEEARPECGVISYEEWTNKNG